MNRRAGVFLCFVGSSALAIAFAACSSGDDSSTGDAGNGADATTDSSKADTSPEKDTGLILDTGTPSDAGPTDSAPPNPDLPCITDDAGCANCCFNNHADGAATYFDTLVTCACTKGATCHAASTCLDNLCKGNGPSVKCDTCLSTDGGCYDQADLACSGDPDCIALNTCLNEVCAPPGDASTD